MDQHALLKRASELTHHLAAEEEEPSGEGTLGMSEGAKTEALSALDGLKGAVAQLRRTLSKGGTAISHKTLSMACESLADVADAMGFAATGTTLRKAQAQARQKR